MLAAVGQADVLCPAADDFQLLAAQPAAQVPGQHPLVLRPDGGPAGRLPGEPGGGQISHRSSRCASANSSADAGCGSHTALKPNCLSSSNRSPWYWIARGNMGRPPTCKTLWAELHVRAAAR